MVGNQIFIEKVDAACRVMWFQAECSKDIIKFSRTTDRRGYIGVVTEILVMDVEGIVGGTHGRHKVGVAAELFIKIAANDEVLMVVAACGEFQT
jgi:hypothetical protein